MLPLRLLALVGLCCITATAVLADPPSSPSRWTAADRKSADDLILQIVSDAPPDSLTLDLNPLIDALVGSRQVDFARMVMRAVATPLVTHDDWAFDYPLLGEEMGKIGAGPEAIDLIPKGASPTNRIQALRAIAIGAADGGYIVDAVKIGNDFISSASQEELRSAGYPLAEAAGASVLLIIDRLAAAGDRSDVDALVARLPDGIARFRAEEDQASLECNDHSGDGRTLIGAMKSEFPVLSSQLQGPFDSQALTEAFAEALALCDGPQSAKAFLGQAQRSAEAPLDDEYIAVAGTLARQRHTLVAVQMLATTKDIDGLVKVGTEIEQAGDAAAARSIASRALSIRLADQQDSDDYSSALGLLLLLESVQDFDDASRAVAATRDSGGRVLEDSGLLHAEIEQRNLGAIAETVATMLADASTQPISDINKEQSLELAADELALNHFLGPAQQVFDAWQATQTILQGQPLIEAQARFAADMGEGTAAMKLAESSGPLIGHPDALSTILLGAMSLDGVKSPTAAQIASALQQAQADSQQTTTGPGASAFETVATGLAQAGNIPAALQAEAQLEQDPAPELDSFRHQTLSAIAAAQAAAGDLEASLATCQRSPDVMDLKTLAVLATQPLSP